MPRIRLNVRKLADLEDLSYLDEIPEESTELPEEDELAKSNSLKNQRLRAQRRWGREISKFQRQNKQSEH